MVIVTNEGLVDLKGVELKNGEKSLTMGEVLSNILMAHRQGNYVMEPMKAFALAQKFSTQEEVDVDDADLDKLRKTIETDKGYAPLVIGQLMIRFSKEEAKKAAEKASE